MSNVYYVEMYTRILIPVHLLVLSIKLFTSRQDKSISFGFIDEGVVSNRLFMCSLKNADVNMNVITCIARRRCFFVYAVNFTALSK
jgi:hypothetical protein